jgi:hypothetical protein
MLNETKEQTAYTCGVRSFTTTTAIVVVAIIINY